MDNATILAALGLICTMITGLFTLWLKSKVTDQQQIIDDLKKQVTTPSQGDVLELYGAAQKTMQAVNKLLRGHGRAVAKQADAIATTVDNMMSPSTTPAPPKKLIGGREGGVGGLIH
jgi:hypothetical protein